MASLGMSLWFWVKMFCVGNTEQFAHKPLPRHPDGFFGLKKLLVSVHFILSLTLILSRSTASTAVVLVAKECHSMKGQMNELLRVASSCLSSPLLMTCSEVSRTLVMQGKPCSAPGACQSDCNTAAVEVSCRLFWCWLFSVSPEGLLLMKVIPCK